jgi:hypothetical protein
MIWNSQLLMQQSKSSSTEEVQAEHSTKH